MREEDEQFFVRGQEYLRFGYRVRPAPRKKNPRHFIGGRPQHANASCGTCDRPLLVLWDIDCTDPLFKREGRPLFGKLRRLPLYYCWTCSTWLAYQLSGGRFTMIKQDPTASFQENWPYPNYPLELPRVGAVLEAIPSDIEKICLVGDQVGDEWLTATDHKRFAAWQGRRSFFDLHRQQLGGLPHLAQGHEKHLCPNKKCGWAKKYGNYTLGGMKELASVHNDPHKHLPLIEPAAGAGSNEWVQVVFWICPACLTIRADQYSD